MGEGSGRGVSVVVADELSAAARSLQPQQILGAGRSSMRIIVCGSRNWVDYNAITSRLDRLPENAVIVHGGAPGADRLAAMWAELTRHETEEHKADWDRHGKAAGPIRNQEMVDAGADLAIAFRLNGASRGTDDCIRRATSAGIPVEVVTPGGSGVRVGGGVR